jgi:hypothetical protein
MPEDMAFSEDITISIHAMLRSIEFVALAVERKPWFSRGNLGAPAMGRSRIGKFRIAHKS